MIEKPHTTITDNQRQKFRRWSEELENLDDADKEAEARAWIESALSILDNPGVESDGKERETV